MTIASELDRAEAFRRLHRPGNILVLPNAWDVASARIFEEAGFAAVGTTSAGIAWSFGYPDGQRLPRELLTDAVKRIAAAVCIPVTVDLETGYGRTTAEVCDAVRAVIDAGGIGINIEDGRRDGQLAPPAVLVEKVVAIRNLCEREGRSLFINARTDTYMLATGDPAARFEQTVERLDAYTDAGADGLFVPGLSDLDEIARLIRRVRRPLNIYASAGVPVVRELARVGVARLSVGCGPMQATLALVRRIATELLQAGTYVAFTEQALPYGEVDRLFLDR